MLIVQTAPVALDTVSRFRTCTLFVSLFHVFRTLDLKGQWFNGLEGCSVARLYSDFVLVVNAYEASTNNGLVICIDPEFGLP